MGLLTVEEMTVSAARGGTNETGLSKMRGDSKPTVCVIGLGYIGLPTAAIIARAGCPVHGVDVTQSVVDTINRGEIHIEEVDLDGLVQAVVQRGMLKASTGVAEADVFVVAVPTPFAKDGAHTPDTSYVMDATRKLARVLKRWEVKNRVVTSIP